MDTTIRYDSPQLNLFSELIGICTLPQLLQDIEDNAIHKDNFVEFNKILEINFPVLLDLLSSPAFIQELCDEEEHDTLLLRQKLILLMCEHAPITPNTIPPYTIDNSELFGNLRRICLSHLTSGPLLTQCMDIYKQQLLDNKWKRSMGTCYGFVHFCDLFTNSPENQVDLQSILFILSIASQFIDCIHGEIRLLGLRLYAIILTQCPRQQILETNVHKVIIKSCLDNSQKLLAEDCLLLLWTCVTQAVCLDNQRLLKDLNWNEVDDSLHLLFQKIKLESNRALRQKLRSLLQAIVIKCFGEASAGELLATSDLLQVQQEIHSRAIKNVKLFRWLRDFKELFIFECLSVSNSVESTKEALLFISQVFLLTFGGLPAKIIKGTLEDLAQRITPLMLEICHLYKDNAEIVWLITQFLRMLLIHLDQISTEIASQTITHRTLKKFLDQQHLLNPSAAA